MSYSMLMVFRVLRAGRTQLRSHWWFCCTLFVKLFTWVTVNMKQLLFRGHSKRAPTFLFGYRCFSLSLSLSLSFSHTFSSFPSFSLSNEFNPSISFFHASNHLATSPSIPPTLSTPPPSLSLLSVVSFGDELSVPSFLVAVYEKWTGVSILQCTTVYYSVLQYTWVFYIQYTAGICIP